MRRKWTESEIKFLIENYNKFSNSKLSEKMDRTSCSIEKKLKSLNLKKSSRNLSMKWSDDDVKFLLDNYSDMTNKELSDRLGRSPKTILNRASKIGLSKSKSHVSKISKDRVYKKLIDNDSNLVCSDSKYNCKECGDGFNNLHNLQIHISKKHKYIDLEDYYINNIDSSSDCKYCNDKSSFISLELGYSDRCDSDKCLSMSRSSGSNEYHMINYGDLELQKEQLSKRLKSLKIGDNKRLKENPKYYKEKSHNSKEYWLKRGYSEEESTLKSKLVVEYMQSISHEIRKSNPDKYLHSYNTKIEYYLNKGMSKEEAEAALIDRQTTFSKKICIEKYGEKDGIRIWSERQSLWKKKLIEGGNLKTGFSKVSQELFNDIEKIIPINNFYYATKNKEFYINVKGGDFYQYDFVDRNNNKIIEFNGDIYHANPKIFKSTDNPNPYRRYLTSKDIWDKDSKKMEECKKRGFDWIIVWESDYRKDKDDRCIDFLLKNN